MRRILAHSLLCHMALGHKWIIRLPPNDIAALHRQSKTLLRKGLYNPHPDCVCVSEITMTGKIMTMALLMCKKIIVSPEG